MSAAERKAASLVGHRAGELLSRFGGHADATQIAGCHRVARMLADLDEKMPGLRSTWESGDEARFTALARDYLRLSAQLFDLLFTLTNGSDLFDGTDGQDRTAMHLAISDNLVLRLCRLEAEAAA